jgi:hypothetical protein
MPTMDSKEYSAYYYTLWRETVDTLMDASGLNVTTIKKVVGKSQFQLRTTHYW